MLHLIACAALAADPSVPIAHSDPEPLRDRVAAAGLSWPPVDVTVFIDKSDRRLVVSSGTTALKTYRVGLGGAPVGDKVRQGDERTPTGTFHVVTRNDRSAYHLFLGLSYPTAEDAERGLRDGLISSTQAEAITTADRSGAVPPWSTPLGGAIGIHGNGGQWDWTLGCIAVDDDEIEELWDVVRRGATVTIQE